LQYSAVNVIIRQNECTSTELLEMTQILTANKLLYKVSGQSKCWCSWRTWSKLSSMLSARGCCQHMFSRCCGMSCQGCVTSLLHGHDSCAPYCASPVAGPVSVQNTRWSSTSFAGDRGRADHCSSCSHHCHLAVSGSSFWLRLTLIYRVTAYSRYASQQFVTLPVL